MADERIFIDAEYPLAKPCPHALLHSRDHGVGFIFRVGLGRNAHIHLTRVRHRADGRVALLHQVFDALAKHAFAHACRA